MAFSPLNTCKTSQSEGSHQASRCHGRQFARILRPFGQFVGPLLRQFSPGATLLFFCVFGLLLFFTTSGEISSVRRIKQCCKIRARVEPIGLLQTPAAMRRPSFVARIGVPVARGAFDAFKRRQSAAVLFEPDLETFPLTKQ